MRTRGEIQRKSKLMGQRRKRKGGGGYTARTKKHYKSSQTIKTPGLAPSRRREEVKYMRDLKPLHHERLAVDNRSMEGKQDQSLPKLPYSDPCWTIACFASYNSQSFWKISIQVMVIKVCPPEMVIKVWPPEKKIKAPPLFVSATEPGKSGGERSSRGAIKCVFDHGICEWREHRKTVRKSERVTAHKLKIVLTEFFFIF